MTRRTLLLAALALAQLPASRSDACSYEANSTATIEPVLPVMSSTAPTNTWIWIAPPAYWSGDRVDIDTVTVEQNGIRIDVVPHAFVMQDEVGSPGFRLAPQVELTPGATIVVKAGTTVLTQFTVGTGRDDTPPAPPVLRRVDVDGEYFGGFSCPEAATVAVRVAVDPADDEVIVLGTRASGPFAGALLGMSSHYWVGGVDFEEGELHLRLFATDLANNTSYTDVPELTVPSRQSGCAATTNSTPAWPWIAIAVLALRRRRRG
jgi:uncharacterized protein (TIGR03382 family)